MPVLESTASLSLNHDPCPRVLILGEPALGAHWIGAWWAPEAVWTPGVRTPLTLWSSLQCSHCAD